MAVKRLSTIYAGAAVIYIGSAFTKTTTEVTTKINNVAGYSEVATSIVVDDAATIAPHVSTTTLADPPICDVIVNCNTKEIMICYFANTGTNTLSVVRGVSKWFLSQRTSDTSYNAVITDDDDLQLLGYGSFPDLSSDFIFTDGDVKITSSYDTFQVRDNVFGFAEVYTGAPGELTIECEIPKNVIAQYANSIGRQRLNDVMSASITYMKPMGIISPGTLITPQFVVVYPLEQYKSTETFSVGGSTYHSHTRAFLFPYAMLDPSEEFTMAEGAQLNVPAKFLAGRDDIFCMSGWHGWYKDAHRLLKAD